MRTMNNIVLTMMGGAALVSGCQLIAGLDSDAQLMREGEGGMAGAGGGCGTPADCPDPMNECVTPTCMAGACGTDNVASGKPTTVQTAGDCKQDVCNGMGGIATLDDDTDIPNDHAQCTIDTCNGGTPVHNPLPKRDPCAQDGGKACNGAGACVECNIGPVCVTGICTNSVCVMINGCSFTSATDMTAMGVVPVHFGGTTLGDNYDPKCLKVSQGSMVTFTANGPSSFVTHPLMGGEVINGMKVPAMMGTNPFVPVTNMGSTATFTMSNTGIFPYCCDIHALDGMTGVVIGVP